MDAASAVAAFLPDAGRVLEPLAAGLFARMAAIVLVVAPTVVPGVSLGSRLAAALVLTLAALPAALAVSVAEGTGPASGWSAMAALVAGESLVGAALGFVVAALAGAVAWGGAVLGGASGLAWQPDDDGPEAGVAALARWFSLGAFVGAGGLTGVVVAVIDGTRALPVGSMVAGDTSTLVGLVAGASSSAIALAVAVSLPGLVAILAFHLVAALVLRAGTFAAGPGLVPAAMALVVMAALFHGASDLGAAAGARVRHTIDGMLVPAGERPAEARR